ncbi:hypothetical protein BCR33DRAFT_732327 [Rhizoclosmatium globosum]|uniref:Uncharacterized protein n=1 Tax=Rhizoclosmatium globosum TaxID=329046 RepID=A0A1Y2D2A8_9FUNG|nr:hypothetical protein BCR33DRAFT_732327 [Rhizoclosmatium globosum]|eukprot:ORY53422.1 hypothetical protein BCR33DRAFT_732327 [Rhizoclosmatium globosum]
MQVSASSRIAFSEFIVGHSIVDAAVETLANWASKQDSLDLSSGSASSGSSGPSSAPSSTPSSAPTTTQLDRNGDSLAPSDSFEDNSHALVTAARKLLSLEHEHEPLSNSTNHNPLALVLRAAAILSKQNSATEPQPVATEKLAAAAIDFFANHKQRVFDLVFKDPTIWVLRSLNLSCSEDYSGDLYLALLDSLLGVKLNTRPNLNMPVSAVFPFLDARAVGPVVLDLLKEYMADPSNFGVPFDLYLSSLKSSDLLELADLEVEVESFHVPSDSVFWLDGTITVQQMHDEILSDSTLLAQLEPYMEAYAYLCTPEIVLELFYAYLVDQGMIESVVDPVFHEFLEAEAGDASSTMTLSDAPSPIHTSRSPTLFSTSPTSISFEPSSPLHASISSSPTTLFSPSYTFTTPSFTHNTHNHHEINLSISSWVYPSTGCASKPVFRYDRFKELLDFAGVTNSEVTCVYTTPALGDGKEDLCEVGEMGRDWVEAKNMFVEAVLNGLHAEMDEDTDEDDDEGDVWPWESTVDNDEDGDLMMMMLEV